jgi:uncharacterized protein (DUF2236 family)
MKPLNPLRLIRWITGAQIGSDLPISDTTPDPGIFGPGSATWQLHAERWLIFCGARAFLMQGAHPKVAQGVLDHSGYDVDPFGRVYRTIQAMSVLFFGTTREVNDMARNINRVHHLVQGTLPDAIGRYPARMHYSAMDPEALLWVHIGFVDSVLTAYRYLVGPISDDLCERYWQESFRYARRLGLTDDELPPTYAAVQDYIRAAYASGEIAVGPGTITISRQVLYPPLPLLRRPLWALIRVITMGQMPPELRRDYGYVWKRRHEWVFRGLCAGLRLMRRQMPHVLGQSELIIFAERRIAGALQTEAADVEVTALPQAR